MGGRIKRLLGSPRHGRAFANWTLVVCLAWCTNVYGQEKPIRLTFDVASIRPSKPGEQGGAIKPLPGGNGYSAQNISVKLMISLMYRVPIRQITGGPDWLDTDHFDVQAKADHAYSIEDLHVMFQNLLADRFNLKFHKETKEGPVYALMVDKAGSKMKLNESAQDFQIPITFGKGNAFVGTRVPMQYLSWWLGLQLQDEQRPVIDQTGLNGTYDFTLSFAPPNPPNVQKDNLPAELMNRPSIFEALKEQLGLRLQPQKGAAEYYVVDHIDKPSDN
jgi:uncharacterized protein (TIGR03435 family)